MSSLMAMFFFELKRLVTPARSFWWLCIAVFPVCIILLLQTFGDLSNPEEMQRQMMRSGSFNSEADARLAIDAILTVVVFYLGPGVACMLGALLTASPAVASELEQHSWVYFATRPNGLFHLVVGKYLVAVAWAGSSTLMGVWLAMSVANVQNKLDTAVVLSGVTMLSAMAYSALYMMIGTLFYRRAMIFCVGYTAAIELFLSFLPAVINRLTIQYRLRILLLQGIEKPQALDDPEFNRLFVTGETPFVAILWLVTLSAVFMAVALTSVQVREFTGAAETEST